MNGNIKNKFNGRFSANWSASDRPIFPYNSGTEARIEAPQVPEDRAR